MRWSRLALMIGLALTCLIVVLISWTVSVRQATLRQKANDVDATLPDRGFRPIVQELRSNVSSSRHLAFSSDGRFVASDGIDFSGTPYHQPGFGIINLWRVDNPSSYSILRLSERGNMFTQICFAPHNTRLYACNMSSIIIWDLSTLEIQRTINFGWDNATKLCLSPDCAKAAMSRPHQVDVYKVMDKSVICALASKPCIRLLFSPDGQKLAAVTQPDAEDGEPGVENLSHGAEIVVWNLTQQGVPVRIRASDPYDYTLCFSPDGNELAGGSQFGHVYIWNTTGTGKDVTIGGKLDISPATIRGVAFSPRAKLIAVGKQRDASYIEIYDREQNMRKSIIQCGIGTLGAVAFMPGGDDIAGLFEEGVIRTWNLKAYKNAGY